MNARKYKYHVIFGKAPKESEISVVIPDLECATSGIDEEDARASAVELLRAVISGLLEDHEDIPEARSIQDIRLKETEWAEMIEISEK